MVSTKLPTIELKDINFRRFLFVRRFLLLSVVMGLVAAAIVVFALIPQLQQIVETQNQIQQQNTILSNLRKKIQGLAQVNDLEEYTRKDMVDQALPIQKPLLQLLENSRRVSAQTGVRIITIETAPGKLATASAATAPAAASSVQNGKVQVHGVDKMDITVTIQGNINQISDFIRRIELTTPLTNVTEISLTDGTKPGSSGGLPEFSANLRLSSYYFTRAIEVAVDAPLPETGVKERQFLQSLEQYDVSSQAGPSQQVEGGGREDLFGIGTSTPSKQ